MRGFLEELEDPCVYCERGNMVKTHNYVWGEDSHSVVTVMQF